MHIHSSGHMGLRTLTRHALGAAYSPPFHPGVQEVTPGVQEVTPGGRHAGLPGSSGGNRSTSSGSGGGVPLLPAAGCVGSCVVQAC